MTIDTKPPKTRFLHVLSDNELVDFVFSAPKGSAAIYWEYEIGSPHAVTLVGAREHEDVEAIAVGDKAQQLRDAGHISLVQRRKDGMNQYLAVRK